MGADNAGVPFAGVSSLSRLMGLSNPEDGRSQHLLLTRTGKQLATQTATATQAMEAELNQRLSSAEHAMLIELLDKLARPPVA